MFSMPDGPLQTVRVLDYSRSSAAGRAARQLADLGARVVRTSMPSEPRTSLDVGTHRLHINWDAVEGQQLALRLSENADVVLFDSDNAPSPLIDADRLLDRSPTVVAASMSRYGAAAPDDTPHPAAVAATSDARTTYLAGALLAETALAAVINRRATRQGQWVHTSVLEAALATSLELREELADDAHAAELAMQSMASTGSTIITRHPVTATETPTVTRPNDRAANEVAHELCAELGFTDNAVPALLEAGALLAASEMES